MPQISPVNVSFPTEGPGGEPGRAPQIRLDFSGMQQVAGIGHALERNAEVIGQASDRFFNTAQKFQQMRNNVEASDLNAENLQQRVADLEEFRTLQGANASPEALRAAMDKMEQHRQELLAKASNPYVANAVNIETRGTNARVGVQMADWAGGQMRKAQDDSLTGALQNQRNLVMRTPLDDDIYSNAVNETNSISDRQNATLGQLPDTAQAAKDKNISMLKAARITGILDSGDINHAETLFNRERPTMDQHDIQDLEQKINTKRNVVIPRTISNAVVKGAPANATPKEQATLSLVQRPLRSVVEQIQRDDHGYEFAIKGITRTGSSRDTAWVPAGATGIKFGESKPPVEAQRYAIGQFESGQRYDNDTPSVGRDGRTHHALGKYGIMEYNLSPWLREAGMPDMTPEAFKKNRAAQDQLFDFKFGQYLDKYGTFNKAAAAWFAGEGGMNTTTVQDRFLTTVPRYLANVNANLASWARGGVAQGPPREIDLQPIDPVTGMISKDPDAKAELDSKMESAAARLGIPLEVGPDNHYRLPTDYDVNSAPDVTPETVEEAVARGLERAQKISTDPIFTHNVESEIRSAFSERRRMEKLEEQQNVDLLWDGIMNKGDGQPSTKMGELLADPARQAAYNRLPHHVQGTIPAKMVAYNKSIEVRTDPSDKYTIMGWWKDNPEEFLKIDPTGPEWEGKLSRADIQWIISQQRAIIRSPRGIEHDPNIARFIRVMEPRIAGSAAAKIMDRNAPAGDIRNLNYYRFVGAYQSELEGMPDKGKNLTTEQIQKIGDALLYQQVTTPAVKGQWIQGLNPFSTVPFRDQPAELGKPRFISAYDRLNADQREDIAKQLQKKRGENATITTLDIQVEAARQELERLMPGGPAPGAGPARRPGE